MGFLESIPYGLFTFVLVFAVLALLYALVLLFSLGIRAFERHRAARAAGARASVFDEPDAAAAAASALESAAQNAPRRSDGELRLHGVDERTAALLMAVVADAAEIPLSELRFRSIRAVGPAAAEAKEARP